MSKIKRWVEEELTKLSEETGYDWDYLLDAYNFFTNFGTDSLVSMEDFKEMARNHNFDGIDFLTF